MSTRSQYLVKFLDTAGQSHYELKETMTASVNLGQAQGTQHTSVGGRGYEQKSHPARVYRQLIPAETEEFVFSKAVVLHRSTTSWWAVKKDTELGGYGRGTDLGESGTKW